jgi:uncharacterized protein
MSATDATPTRPPTALRQVIARHPVTTTLLLMFAVAWGLLIPAALAGITLEGPPLLAAVLLGQLLPAVLVTGAVGGRPAVRELFARIFRWRVHPGWYLLALLGLPVAALLGSAAVFGPGALRALLSDPSVITAYLGLLVLLVPVVNLWEEAAWMGVVQARLAQYRGPLLAAVVTGPLFALVHLPLQLGKPAGDLLLGMLRLMAFAIPLRIVIGWLYNLTGGSILLVAILHATFNATDTTKLLTAAAPDQPLLPWITVRVLIVAWALLVVALTRGQLGSHRDRRPVLEG